MTNKKVFCISAKVARDNYERGNGNRLFQTRQEAQAWLDNVCDRTICIDPYIVKTIDEPGQFIR